MVLMNNEIQLTAAQQLAINYYQAIETDMNRDGRFVRPHNRTVRTLARLNLIKVAAFVRGPVYMLTGQGRSLAK